MKIKTTDTYLDNCDMKVEFGVKIKRLFHLKRLDPKLKKIVHMYLPNICTLHFDPIGRKAIRYKLVTYRLEFPKRVHLLIDRITEGVVQDLGIDDTADSRLWFTIYDYFEDEKNLNKLTKTYDIVRMAEQLR